MAAPSYTEDLTDITLAENTTGWSALGGGASGLAAGVDFAMQGTNCVDKQVTASEKGQVYDNGSTITPGANEHFFVWVFLATPGQTDTRANRGLTIAIGTSTTAYNKFHVEGNDTYGNIARVGKCYAIRYVTTSNGSHPYRTLVGSPGANPQFFGALTNILGTVKGSNLGVDAIRRGTGAYMTAGELLSAGDGTDNPCTFTGFASTDATSSNRWGILIDLGGGIFELQGRFAIGQNNAGTATLARFRDSNKTILIVDTFHSLTDFTQIIIDHASTRVEWTNINITALGTNNPGRLVVNSNNPTFIDNGGVCSGMGITTLRSNTTSTGRIWRACGQITANGAKILEAIISGYEGTANTSALVWDTADDPDSRLDGTSFVKGTAATHAIEFGTTSPLTMTLTNVNFSGYNASNGQNDSAIHIKRTTGTVTINIDGGTTPSYRTDGATVVIVSGTVTVAVNVKDAATGANIQNARVFTETSDGTGPFPFEATVTITRSGATATVAHTAHNMATNDKVVIRGANQQEYNGIHQITFIDANSYSFAVSGTPTTPATGTIKSSFVPVEGLTDSSGNISATRVYATDQPIKGTVRKSTSSPLYKAGGILTTIDNLVGASVSVQLVRDD